MSENDSGVVAVQPVGYVLGGREEVFDDAWDDVDAVIRLESSRFGPEALYGLDAFSHLEVVFHFDRVPVEKIETGARHPRGNTDWPLVGIFAQRGKNRPNRLGVSRCRLRGVDGPDLHVAGLDAVAGTPVLDIKPYMAEFGPCFDSQTPQGLLAHAEMAALATVPDDKDHARRLRLYTTLHPCPMCLGAMVIARIGHLHFGAYDPTWLGIEQLPQLNDEIRNRWPSVEGPLPGPVGEWLAVLPALHTNGTLVRAMRQATPHRADLAIVVAETLTRGELPRSPELALEKVWDLLPGA